MGGDAATSGVVIALVRAGDWFGRFDVMRAAPSAPVITAIDRDGTVHTGAAAVSLLLSRLPLTFPVVAPMRLLSRHRRRMTATVAA